MKRSVVILLKWIALGFTQPEYKFYKVISTVILIALPSSFVFTPFFVTLLSQLQDNELSSTLSSNRVSCTFHLCLRKEAGFPEKKKVKYRPLACR